MINLEKIQHDISELPEEAQTLVIDFIESLKKRYSVVTAFFKIMRYIPPAPCLLPPASKRQSVHLTNMRSAINLPSPLIINLVP